MNTKQDYLNLEQSEYRTMQLQGLISNRFIWKDICVLETEEGVEDDTHRVEERDGDYIQQEYVEDPNALIFRLGFTVEEVEELLGGN